jgi:hypothetical protein
VEELLQALREKHLFPLDMKNGHRMINVASWKEDLTFEPEEMEVTNWLLSVHESIQTEAKSWMEAGRIS